MATLNYNAVPFEMNPYQTYINSNYYQHGCFQQPYVFQKNFYTESSIVQNRPMVYIIISLPRWILFHILD